MEDTGKKKRKWNEVILSGKCRHSGLGKGYDGTLQGYQDPFFVSKQNLNNFAPSFVLEGKMVIDGQLMALVQSQHPQTKKK